MPNSVEITGWQLIQKLHDTTLKYSEPTPRPIWLTAVFLTSSTRRSVSCKLSMYEAKAYMTDIACAGSFGCLEISSSVLPLNSGNFSIVAG